MLRVATRGLGVRGCGVVVSTGASRRVMEVHKEVGERYPGQ